jgi:hypothetical protein
MDKQTLVRDLKSHVGGAAFINQSQLAKYLKSEVFTLSRHIFFILNEPNIYI